MNGDPGWSAAVRDFAVTAVPIVGLAFLRHRSKNPTPLVATRALFLQFAWAIALIGLVVLILRSYADFSPDAGTPPLDAGPTATAAVAFVGAGAIIASRLVGRLDGSTPEQLLGSWRTRFFLRMALSEAAALLGFVGFVLTYSLWPWLAGLGISAIGFALLAPTARQIQADQEHLAEQGCAFSLLAAVHPPASGDTA